MLLACCQGDIAWEDKACNYGRVESLLSSAALQPETLVLLPEMFATGFTMQSDAVAEPIDGPTTSFLSEIARRFSVWVLGGAVIRSEEASRPRNEALVFDSEGRLVSRYAKQQLFSFANEPEHYAPGEAATVFSWRTVPVAVNICYDLRFPELFRADVERGAEILTVIACWPASREEHWLTLLRARAIENQCYVAAVNRTGSDPSGLAYSGRSQIIDPRGRILADAGGGQGCIHAAVDVEALRTYRHEFPALRDRK